MYSHTEVTVSALLHQRGRLWAGACLPPPAAWRRGYQRSGRRGAGALGPGSPPGAGRIVLGDGGLVVGAPSSGLSSDLSEPNMVSSLMRTCAWFD